MSQALPRHWVRQCDMAQQLTQGWVRRVNLAQVISHGWGEPERMGQALTRRWVSQGAPATVALGGVGWQVGGLNVEG